MLRRHPEKDRIPGLGKDEELYESKYVCRLCGLQRFGVKGRKEVVRIFTCAACRLKIPILPQPTKKESKRWRREYRKIKNHKA